MRYSLLVLSEEATVEDIGEEVMQQFMAAFDAYAKSLDDAGVLISAEILQPVAATTTLTLRGGNGLQVQDGPFADTKEKLNGTYLIDVPDLDAALAWAEKCPGAQYGVIEIRPTAIYFGDHHWIQAG